MAKTEEQIGVRLVSAGVLRKLADDLHVALGVTYDPDATVDRVRSLMDREGIVPEDNEFTAELLRMRYGDDV